MGNNFLDIKIFSIACNTKREITVIKTKKIKTENLQFSLSIQCKCNYFNSNKRKFIYSKNRFAFFNFFY